MTSRLVKRTTRRYLGALLYDAQYIRMQNRVGDPRTTCSSPGSPTACEHSLYVRISMWKVKRTSGLAHTIGLALTATTVLHLEAREVRVGLDLLDERHLVGSAAKVSSSPGFIRKHPSPSIAIPSVFLVRTLPRDYAGVPARNIRHMDATCLGGRGS